MENKRTGWERCFFEGLCAFKVFDKKNGMVWRAGGVEIVLDACGDLHGGGWGDC